MQFIFLHIQISHHFVAIAFVIIGVVDSFDSKINCFTSYSNKRVHSNAQTIDWKCDRKRERENRFKDLYTKIYKDIVRIWLLFFWVGILKQLGNGMRREREMDREWEIMSENKNVCWLVWLIIPHCMVRECTPSFNAVEVDEYRIFEKKNNTQWSQYLYPNVN